MKTVYLDIAGHMHSLYKQLVLYPPLGYQIITQTRGWDNTFNTLSRNNVIFNLQENAINKLIPVNLTKAYLEKFKKIPEQTDLTYSTGHLVFRKEPWIVDMEFVTQLAGYSIGHFKRYRRLIESYLTSSYCKKIICWTNAGKQTVEQNMDCAGFEHKVEMVPLAVTPKKFVREHHDNKRIKLLFVGSANIPGEFDINGGKEVLEAFVLLRQKYDNVDMVIRSDMPPTLKMKYGQEERLRIIDRIIPWQELENEFEQADIFLFPAHTTPGLVMLDAMSYELPIITTDVWANPEMVTDNVTGLVIKKSDKVKYYTENFIPTFNHLHGSLFMRSIQSTDARVVEELVDKTSILIENPELRRKMGRNGRQEIESGRFSLSRRNERLKKIFDDAIDQL